MVPAGFLVLKEWVKEHRVYRRLFILGRKGGSGRWGGVREYFRRDCSKLVANTASKGVQKSDFSTLYLGKTNWVDDYRLGGRHIGSVGEQHHIICSVSGGGKSKYVLGNQLAMWNGGACIFDIKGEHYRRVGAYRAKHGLTYLLDPFGDIKTQKSNCWNPLDEIDPESNTAKSDLTRLCEAIVFEKNSDGKNDHFKEIGQQVLRGFIAHIMTKYPKEKRNFPAVYDLFEKGYLEGETPKKILCLDIDGKPVLDSSGGKLYRDETHTERLNQIFKDMAKNDAIGNAPSEAAARMERVGGNERGSFYSTVAKALSWCNDASMRHLLTKSDFSVREIKSKEAWCFLVLPEKYMDAQMRFVRGFFQMALDMVDNFTTPRKNNRQMLFLFEEFNKFGYFKAAEDVACFKRSSGVKGIFVVQNIGQFARNYPNEMDFLGNADQQIFSLAQGDYDTAERISKILGTYKQQGRSQGGEYMEVERKVLEPKEVAENLDGEDGEQIFIPVKGKPLMLNKVACYKNFKWTKD